MISARLHSAQFGVQVSSGASYVCRTFRISDPAPVISALEPRRNRGVHCIRLVRPDSGRRNHNTVPNPPRVATHKGNCKGTKTTIHGQAEFRLA